MGITYKCSSCNYNTYDIRDMKKHMKTKKHIKLNGDTKSKTKTFKCPFCNTELKIRDVCDHIRKCISNIKVPENSIIMKNIDTKPIVYGETFINKYFNSGMTVLEINNNYQDIMQAKYADTIRLIYTYRTVEKMTNYIANVIAKKYINTNHENQTLWCIDIARNKYAFRATDGDKIVWKIDKKGEYITNNIIIPHIEYFSNNTVKIPRNNIVDILTEYEDEKHKIDNNLEKSGYDILMESHNELDKQYSEGKISEEICDSEKGRLRSEYYNKTLHKHFMNIANGSKYIMDILFHSQDIEFMQHVRKKCNKLIYLSDEIKSKYVK